MESDTAQVSGIGPALDHPLAVEEWLASRILEHAADAREVCRLALINRNFLGPSLSDLVWQKRLPPKPVLDAILDSSPLHGTPLSKRDLYMQFCKSISYDNDLKKFWLDRTSGADCYMISARALSIAWGDTPQYWNWPSLPGAMFSEVAYLRSVCWFDVSGRFQQLLRPGKYLVSFRIQLITPEVGGWQKSPIKLSLQNVSYAHPPHLSQVLFDGTTTFKRRYCPLPDTSLAPQLPHTSDTKNFVHPQMPSSDTSLAPQPPHTSDTENFVHPQMPASDDELQTDHIESDDELQTDHIESDDEHIEAGRPIFQSAPLTNASRCGFSATTWVENDDHDGTPLFHTKGYPPPVWTECDVGEFLVEDDNGGRPVEIHFSMQEIKVLWWKGGFVLDGVIIRPSLVAESCTIE